MKFLFLFLRLIVNIHPVKKEADMEQKVEPEVDIMNMSMYGTLMAREPKDSGPFSSKRVVHESDTPHSNPLQGE